MWTVLLLIISNVFMTAAWYGHLRHKEAPLLIAIVVSWLIAFAEYCFQVPANRIGSNQGFAAAELKTIQEVITLVVFVFFSTWYLKEKVTWNVLVGFAFVALGAAFVFQPWKPTRAAILETGDVSPPAQVDVTPPDDSAP